MTAAVPTSLRTSSPRKIPAGSLTSREAYVTKWEYASVPLIVHSIKEILDLWGDKGYELVSVLEIGGAGLVAIMKKPKTD